MQIIGEFDFFNKLSIILKFSQHQWIIKAWNNCLLLLFLKLFAAHRLLEIYVMRDWFRFSTYKLFVSFVFSTKIWSLLNSPNINKNLLFKVYVVFYYFFTFSNMYIVCWGLIPWKKVLLLLACFSLQKN